MEVTWSWLRWFNSAHALIPPVPGEPLFLLGLLSRMMFTCTFAARTVSEAHGTCKTHCAGADGHRAAEILLIMPDLLRGFNQLGWVLRCSWERFPSSPRLAAAQDCVQVSQQHTQPYGGYRPTSAHTNGCIQELQRTLFSRWRDVSGQLHVPLCG